MAEYCKTLIQLEKSLIKAAKIYYIMGFDSEIKHQRLFWLYHFLVFFLTLSYHSE